MPVTHNQTLGVNTDGRGTLSGTQSETGSSELLVDQNVPSGYTDFAVAFATASLQSVILLANQAMTIQVGGTDEVQRITITGTPTGGTFTLTFETQTTAGIAFNAIASAVQTALEALSNVVPGDVACTGGPLPGTPVTVTFTDTLGRANRTQMTTTDSLSGGTSPASAITTITGGVAPDVTLNLLAQSPLVWWRSQAYFADPFPADSTVFRVLTTSSNRLRGKFLIK